VAAALTKDNIITAIDEATATMDGNEVPQEGRILYVNSDLKPALKILCNSFCPPCF
jgi:hypothetical protein